MGPSLAKANAVRERIQAIGARSARRWLCVGVPFGCSLLLFSRHRAPEPLFARGALIWNFQIGSAPELSSALFPPLSHNGLPIGRLAAWVALGVGGVVASTRETAGSHEQMKGNRRIRFGATTNTKGKVELPAPSVFQARVLLLLLVCVCVCLACEKGKPRRNKTSRHQHEG